MQSGVCGQSSEAHHQPTAAKHDLCYCPEWQKTSIIIGVRHIMAEASKPLEICQMDTLLGSKEDGPITQCLRQKENKVILTFSDHEEKKAISIMET